MTIAMEMIIIIVNISIIIVRIILDVIIHIITWNLIFMMTTATRTTRTPAFWGYPPPPPPRLMITHTIESCWIPSHNKVEWPWRYRSRSNVITCDTPSHASDHLYQIWKESIQNCSHYRADTIFKVKAEWPWKYRSRSKVITCDTPSDAYDDLCQKWKECKQYCRFFFKAKAEKFEKLAKNSDFIILL